MNYSLAENKNLFIEIVKGQVVFVGNATRETKIGRLKKIGYEKQAEKRNG
jgi:hypothetical protein